MNYRMNKAIQKPKAANQDYLDKSLHALRQQKFQDAIALAEKAIKKNPLLANGYNALAYAYDKSGQPDKALDIMLNNKSQGKHAGYYLYCGELLLKRMDYEQAIEYFKRSLELQPDNNNARIGLIHIYRKQGNNVLAHIEFLKICKERELTFHEKNIYMDCITRINFLSDPLGALRDIDNLLNDVNVEKRKAAGKVGELLVQTYPDIKDAVSLGHPILSNVNFLSLLKKFPMANADIDYLLTCTRKLLLLSIAEHGEISDENLELCLAIAQQNFLNEYIHYITDDEIKLLAVFNELLISQAGDQHWQAADSEAIIVVLLMYGSLDLLPEKISAQLDLTLWPNRLWPYVTEQLLNRAIEIQMGDATPSLTEMSADTPDHVRAQYEENPYPRWTECTIQNIGSLGQYIHNLQPELKLGSEFFNPKMRILVAGCGTGRQAIETSYLYPQATVVAFDISRRSLGYAQRMAKKFSLKNLEFFHGDILALDTSIGSFDLIECCGVLHHLAEPLNGWKNLKNLLTPKGIMRIDLYSKIARQEVIARKKQISELQLAPNLNSLRAFRQAVLTQNTDQFLINFRDFYVASEFRDLLFHQQEVQYSLEEIQESLAALDLNFVGLHINESRLAEFKRTFPQSSVTDLKSWSQFERQHPVTFIGMYSFWCQNNL